jgi:hypothetical protein
LPSTTANRDKHLSELIATATEALTETQQALDELAKRIITLEQWLGLSSGELITPTLARRWQKRTSVGAARLQAVRNYIERSGEARQADIVKDLNLNSGTVSVATNALQDAGDIEAIGKERGSVIWKFTGELGEEPEAQIRVGESVEPERKASEGREATASAPSRPS